MTVSELIEKLKEMPPDSTIYISDQYEEYASSIQMIVYADCESDSVDSVTFYSEEQMKEFTDKKYGIQIDTSEFFKATILIPS